MVQFSLLASAAVAAFSAQSVVAHPGEVHDHLAVKREIRERDAYGSYIARSLEKCKRSEKTRALQQRAVARRSAAAQNLRKRSGIIEAPSMHKRNLTDFEKWAANSHNETDSYSGPYDPASLFAANTSCVVTPEDTVGPYYVLGEHVRSNVTEGETGIPVHLELQFIDVSTCDAVEDPLFVDIWNCNSTGVYSGVSASGEAGLNSTFLRGVQITDSDGVVEFDTLFPGHYDGRATHTHVVTHANSTLLANGTYTGGTVTHIGQLFFDESLRSAVEATYPYTTNTQAVVSNEDDMWTPDSATAEYDPFPEYLYLGSDITDGLIMWISIGVDMSANYTSSATNAAYLAADGGHDSGLAVAGGSGGAPSGASNATGSLPTGTPMTTTF